MLPALFSRPLFKSSRAFTLIELIVVVIVIGILASISYVALNSVVRRSELEAAEITLASVVREASALAAFENRSVYTHDDLSTAATDLPDAMGPGVFAQDVVLGRVVVFGQWEFSGATRVLHGELSSSGEIGLALFVPGAGCAFAYSENRLDPPSTWHKAGVPAEVCSGAVAEDPLSVAGLLPPPTPEWVTVTFDESGAIVEWEDEGPADVYRDGEYVGVGSDGMFVDPNGYDGATYTVVTRDGGSPGSPAGWPNGPGSIWNGTVPSGSSGPGSGSGWSPGAHAAPANGGALTLTWPGGTGSYNVYRNGSLVGTVSSGVWVDVSPVSWNTYEVRPVVGGVEQDPLTPSVAPTPAPPVPVDASQTAGSPPGVTVDGVFATVAWGNVANEPTAPLTGYRLYRQVDGGDTWDESSRVWFGPETSFRDGPLSNGTWCYRVSAYGPGGESGLSVPACGTVSSAAAPGTGGLVAVDRAEVRSVDDRPGGGVVYVVEPYLRTPDAGLHTDGNTSVVALAADGGFDWSAAVRVVEPSRTVYQKPDFVGVAGDGSVYVSGVSRLYSQFSVEAVGTSSQVVSSGHLGSHTDVFYLAKFSSNGVPLWVTVAEVGSTASTFMQYNRDLQVDAAGNAFVAYSLEAYSTGYAWFDTGSVGRFAASKVGSQKEAHLVVLKVSPSGSWLWGAMVDPAFANGSVTFSSLAADESGGVVVGARMSRAAGGTGGRPFRFRHASSGYVTVDHGGSVPLVVARLNDGGQWSWISPVSQTGNGTYSNSQLNVAVHGSQVALVVQAHHSPASTATIEFGTGLTDRVGTVSLPVSATDVTLADLRLSDGVVLSAQVVGVSPSGFIGDSLLPTPVFSSSGELFVAGPWAGASDSGPLILGAESFSKTAYASFWWGRLSGAPGARSWTWSGYGDSAVSGSRGSLTDWVVDENDVLWFTGQVINQPFSVGDLEIPASAATYRGYIARAYPS